MVVELLNIDGAAGVAANNVVALVRIEVKLFTGFDDDDDDDGDDGGDDSNSGGIDDDNKDE